MFKALPQKPLSLVGLPFSQMHWWLPTVLLHFAKQGFISEHSSISVDYKWVSKWHINSLVYFVLILKHTSPPPPPPHVSQIKKTLNILVRIRNRLCRPFKEGSPYAMIYRGSILYINVLKRQFTSPKGKGEENEENLWYLPMQARLLFPVILKPLLQTQAKELFSCFLHSERRGQKSPCLTHSFRAEIKFSCN